MKLKKMLAMAMALTMVTGVMAGCNKNSDSPGTATEGTTKTASAKTEKITFQFLVFNDQNLKVDDVQKAINDITIPTINTEVILKPQAIGTYPEQTALAITGQEDLDLFCTIPAGAAQFTSMKSQNQLMDITQLLNEHGTGIKEALGEEFLSGTTVDGKVYATTSLFCKAIKVYAAMRTDLLDKYGLKEKALAATKLSDLEAIYEEVHKQDPNMVVLVPTSEGNVINLPGIFFDSNEFSGMSLYDDLGDSTKLLGVAKYSDPKKVVSYYETEEVKAMYAKTREWYNKGWIFKDASTTTDTAQEIVKQDNAFGYFFSGEVDAPTAQKNASGHDMTIVEIATNPVQTGSIAKFTWAVPVTSKNPEGAMKFLNLMYTDERIVNLLNYGLEGTHYKTNADGTIGFADGIDGTNTTWGLTTSFLFGNQYLAKVWEGDMLDIREKTKQVNDNAEMSPLLGFSFDNTSVTNEISALTNVISQYRPSLQSGIAAPEKLDEFIAALKAAGLDKYLTTVQTQLDAFNAAK